MTTAAGSELRALREHPFELLRELERRSRLALTGNPGEDAGTEEWVGIGLRLGSERFVVAREEVREVLMLPSTLTRVPGARAWMRGLANVRGHLLPIADLRAFLGGGETGTGRAARVLVANSPEFPVGLIVDEVYGFRRFLQRERVGECAPGVIRADRYIEGALRRGLEVWPVFSVARLLQSREFQRAAED
ncbi:MAG: purine-binding chemotaxis protein CheW [Gammaproteobacteria bacterium]|nr:purine-binding chemotaxis protein CheW [Gammaproteobacteria bacterium]